jgi:nucleoside-diphosphate-sugar epimerase/uncharacterized membrane protein
MAKPRKPIVLITGAAGSIGRALTEELAPDYYVVGFDMKARGSAHPLIEVDLTSDASVEHALEQFARGYGKKIAAVVHLAAYFDFTGEENPLYDKVNVEGTRRLLRALQEFEVDRFIYSGTMLVREAGDPGERIDEETPVAPKWAYPKSKAEAEKIIRRDHGKIPYLILHLAGLYDDESAVPTLSQQIARIYEEDFKSRFYSGDVRVGQAFIHRDDMMRLFRKAVTHRAKLPEELTIVAGEPEAVSYEALQNRIGELIHGEAERQTLSVPKPLAKAAAWLEEKAEPLVPDDFDQGEKPFIRPFMIDMADDHYALDISRAQKMLGWKPRHDISGTLPKIVAALKRDPVAWYEKNKVTPPDWMLQAAARNRNPDELRSRHNADFRSKHQDNLWAHLANMALGSWLVTSPATLGYGGTWLGVSDIVSGVALVLFGCLSLSWRLSAARWAAAVVGLWLLAAPLVFWTPSAAGYLNGTLVGTLAIAFAVLLPPAPGISPVAALTGPDIPPGWSFNPSSWPQRLPVILLAFVGLYFSRYLAAYQLGHIDTVWEPFFSGSPDPKNGTEEIITSSVSEAFPVPDAGLGAAVYVLEILTGVIGSRQRWRTMPWLVTLFGVMIVPLGVVSIGFIIIQPIVIGTWCTLCLIGAAAMLVQIPYSVDELAATLEFLWRRKKAGAPVLKIFFTGDTDKGERKEEAGDFERPPAAILRDAVTGGVGLPWNLGLCILIGIWLMFTRLTLGVDGSIANTDHLIGSLVLTATVTALAEIARPVRLLNTGFGMALLIVPFVLGAPWISIASSTVCGILLILLSLQRGRIREKWGSLGRYII